MNETLIKKTIKEISDEWNSGEYKRRKYAKNKLSLSQWFLPVNTYNTLAKIMGMPFLPQKYKYNKTETIEEKNLLKEAQKRFGGKIINN